MSHIPTSAMPRAIPAEALAREQDGEESLIERAGRLVRAYPATAGALAAGLLVGAAWPLLRRR